MFILTPEAPDGAGGMEHFVREVIRGLDVRGYRTEVFHRGNSEPAWLAKRRGRVGKKIADTLLGYSVGRNAQRQMTENVAAVISNSTVGYLPLRFHSSFKRIHFFHGTYRGQSDAIRPFISYWGYLYLKWWDSMVLERFSSSNKLIISNSEQVRDEVSRFFKSNSTVMWYPLDTEVFQPRDRSLGRRSLGLPDEGAIGLFAGNTQPTKGLPVVESLVRLLPDVFWVLALVGDVPEGLKGRSNVRIVQGLPHTQMPLLYSAADFSVCPSLYESFGYVVAEALACGTPVIASPGGASRLFLGEAPMDRLLVADANSVEGFLGAVQEVVRAPEFYRRAVIERVRPKLEELMAPENWWRRFFALTGL